MPYWDIGSLLIALHLKNPDRWILQPHCTERLAETLMGAQKGGSHHYHTAVQPRRHESKAGYLISRMELLQEFCVILLSISQIRHLHSPPPPTSPSGDSKSDFSLSFCTDEPLNTPEPNLTTERHRARGSSHLRRGEPYGHSLWDLFVKKERTRAQPWA